MKVAALPRMRGFCVNAALSGLLHTAESAEDNASRMA